MVILDHLVQHEKQGHSRVQIGNFHMNMNTEDFIHRLER